MANLTNQVAIVTGGSSGIGQAIALRFAKDGAKVIITGRTEATLKNASEAHENITYQVADMTKTADIEALMDRVEKVYGRLDILVNNAGWCPVQPITEMKIEDYDRAFSLDVRALVEMTIHALPLLRETKGKIIN